jgi:23S rRNA (pseudouridine1915-N3)-methyltransferase
MKLTILAVGKARKTVEAELWADWLKRCPFSTHLQEFESRLPAGPARTKDESQKLLSYISQCSKTPTRLISLDPNGVNISSEGLANILGHWRAEGISQCFFAIGGADGHHASLLKIADKKIAFGRATWPHLLCRAMLAEQLYRAEMILARHPYHRG